MDHRCGTRFTLSLAVELQVKDQTPAIGRLIVASVTGALIEAKRLLPPLTPVLLRPLNTDGADLEIEAYVVRNTEKGVALEWVDPACDEVLLLLPARSMRDARFSAAGSGAEGPVQIPRAR